MASAPLRWATSIKAAPSSQAARGWLASAQGRGQASSAACTWRAWASSGVKTAIVRTPIRRAVAAMRHAISPRLAIRTVRNMARLSPGSVVELVSTVVPQRAAVQAVGLQPVRRAALQKRLDSLATFRAGAGVGNAAGCQVAQRGVDGAACHLVDEALAGPYGLRAVARDGLGQPVHRGLQCARVRHGVVQEAMDLGPGRIDGFRRDEPAPDGALAHSAEDMRADGGRDPAEGRFRQPE